MPKALTFLFSIGTRFFIDLIGRLMFAELLAILCFPFIRFKELFRRFPTLIFVLKALIILLIAQIISDIYNNSSSEDYLRGWALIIIPIFSIIFLTNYFYREKKGIIFFLLGLFSVRLVFGEGELDTSQLLENTNYFKQRFVGFLNPALLLLSFFLLNSNRKKTSVILFFAFAILCFVLDARSNGLVFLIASIILMIKLSKIKITKARFIFGSFIFIILLFIGYMFYVDQVLYNNFGGINSKLQLNKTSNPYNPFELLYYGRTDFIVLIQAIADKPILGHGSWGKDMYGVYAKLTSYLTESDIIRDRGFISAHSIVLGFWTYSGFIGFLAIFFIFYNLFKKALFIFNSNFYTSYLPIVIVVGLQMFWSFFFSPIAHLRTEFPFFMALILIEYQSIKIMQNLPYESEETII